MIYPLLRPAMEQLFEEFQPTFLANAKYRFRDRKQFWPISVHDHLLLKSNRARMALPQNSAHFSMGHCSTASPDDLEVRLKQLTDGTMRMTCINHLEAVIDKVPDAMRYLSDATGPNSPLRKAASRGPGMQSHRAGPTARFRSRRECPRPTTEGSRLDLARLTAGGTRAPRCPEFFFGQAAAIPPPLS